MFIHLTRIIAICLLILINGCSTSLHGAFVATSYAGEFKHTAPEKLGPVEGRSCQTMFLYIFPQGNSPVTDEAIVNTKKAYEDTRFIADISIDDETNWKFGYSIRCVVVRATAYR